MRFFLHSDRRRSQPRLPSTACASFILVASALAQDPTPFGDYQFDLADLAHPADVAVGADDTIYVTDTDRHRILVFDARGQRKDTWGRMGSGPGEFLRPMGLAIGPDGELYVSDTGRHRIQVLSRDGKFQREWGEYGEKPSQFCFPQEVAVDQARVYVADTGNDRVQVFDHEGKHQLTIGRFGSKPAEFKRPVDVAVDSNGNIYVTDADNHRIQKFDRTGRFVKTWGQWGTFAGLLADPGGIHYHNDRLYVADAHNHRVQVFDLDGGVIYQWGIHAFRPREGAGKLHYPNAVAIAPSGKFAVVCEGFENRAQVFAAMPPGKSPPPNPFQGMDMTGSSHYGPWGDIDARLMALTELETDKVSVFDLVSNEPITITTVGGHGTQPGRFVRPTGVALDATTKFLYVADSGNRRLQAFRLDYDPAREIKFDPGMARFVKLLDFETLARRHPKFKNKPIIEPSALRCDAKGNLWMLDQRQALVLIFSDKFELLRFWGGHDDGPGSLRRPTTLAFGESGETVFIADADRHCISAYTMTGKFLFDWGEPGTGDGQFAEPFGIVAGKDGFVYVSDAVTHRVQKFDEKGRFVAAWGTQGIEAGQMYKPRDILQDDRGHLIVVDYGNHRGHVFSQDGQFINVFGSRFFTRPAERRSRGVESEQ